MIDIEKLKEYLKKQTELINVTGKGVCFPVALYNIFPKIFNKDEELIKTICKKFNVENHSIEFYFDYFNKYIEEHFPKSGESLKLTKFNQRKSYEDFVNFLNEKANNLMILVANYKGNLNNYHSVAFLGYDSSNRVIYFENGDNDVLLINCLNGLTYNNTFKPIYPKDLDFINSRKVIDNEILRNYLENEYTKREDNNITYVDSKLIYNSATEIYFIELTKDNSIFRNFSSRLDLLKLPKNMHWTTKEDTEKGLKRLNSHIPIRIVIPEEFNEEYNINE